MRIILVGFMGAGKTVVGKTIAKKLNINFIDIDLEIEKREGKNISSIFKEYGEIYFRNIETNMLKEFLTMNDVIISTGGGVVTIDENCRLIKKENNVIFLDASVDTIYKHLLKCIDKRPLLKDSKNLKESISQLLSKRYNRYKDVSTITIDTNGKNIEQVVSQVLVYII